MIGFFRYVLWFIVLVGAGVAGEWALAHVGGGHSELALQVRSWNQYWLGTWFFVGALLVNLTVLLRDVRPGRTGGPARSRMRAVALGLPAAWLCLAASAIALSGGSQWCQQVARSGPIALHRLPDVPALDHMPGRLSETLRALAFSGMAIAIYGLALIVTWIGLVLVDTTNAMTALARGLGRVLTASARAPKQVLWSRPTSLAAERGFGVIATWVARLAVWLPTAGVLFGTAQVAGFRSLASALLLLTLLTAVALVMGLLLVAFKRLRNDAGGGTRSGLLVAMLFIVVSALAACHALLFTSTPSHGVPLVGVLSLLMSVVMTLAGLQGGTLPKQATVAVVLLTSIAVGAFLLHRSEYEQVRLVGRDLAWTAVAVYMVYLAFGMGVRAKRGQGRGTTWPDLAGVLIRTGLAFFVAKLALFGACGVVNQLALARGSEDAPAIWSYTIDQVYGDGPGPASLRAKVLGEATGRDWTKDELEDVGEGGHLIAMVITAFGQNRFGIHAALYAVTVLLCFAFLKYPDVRRNHAEKRDRHAFDLSYGSMLGATRDSLQVLGLIGTLLGLSAAVSTLGQDDGQEGGGLPSGLTAQLGLAFFTTLVALLLRLGFNAWASRRALADQWLLHVWNRMNSQSRE